MHKGSEFYIAKFLVAVGRLKVCDVAEATDVAAACSIRFSSALLQQNYVQARELTLAADAVRAMEESNVGHETARVLFEMAMQRGISFHEAMTEASSKPAASPPQGKAVMSQILRRAIYMRPNSITA